jgi:hypothetical protein
MGPGKHDNVWEFQSVRVYDGLDRHPAARQLSVHARAQGCVKDGLAEVRDHAWFKEVPTCHAVSAAAASAAHAVCVPSWLPAFAALRARASSVRGYGCG